jgi:2-polyprenyl-3-methyl-5-hydroxy-6-metoxy-1,4-benzoquinol methylase
MSTRVPQFGWKDAGPSCAHDYLVGPVLSLVEEIHGSSKVRIVDLGCGNGYVANRLAELGHAVLGVDASPDGVSIAQSTGRAEFKTASIYDEQLVETTGNDAECVVALEVIEHLYLPKTMFVQSHKILKPGGHLIVSTPYHGYLKNLALSIADGWDKHFAVDWHGGHIKFFSRRTLEKMATAAGFSETHFLGVGRLPWLWKSMIMVFRK